MEEFEENLNLILQKIKDQCDNSEVVKNLLKFIFESSW